MRRTAIVFIGVLVLLMILVQTSGASPPSGPVTIVTAIDFSSFPFSGTFDVTGGSDILGCSSGTFVDFPNGFGSIHKVFTCTDGGNGSFTFIFLPGRSPGPGDQNGHWEAWKSDGDFAGLRGQGDFSFVFIPPASGVETLTGVVHFDP